MGKPIVIAFRVKNNVKISIPLSRPAHLGIRYGHNSVQINMECEFIRPGRFMITGESLSKWVRRNPKTLDERGTFQKQHDA